MGEVNIRSEKLDRIIGRLIEKQDECEVLRGLLGTLLNSFNRFVAEPTSVTLRDLKVTVEQVNRRLDIWDEADEEESP